MKRIVCLYTTGFCFITLLLLSACNNDPCEEVSCVNGQLAENGNSCSCECDDHYEGVACDELERTKVIGTYTADDNCSGTGALSYILSISSATNPGQVRINNLWDFIDEDVIATITGNSISIAQQVPGNGNYRVQGSGSYNSSSKTLSLSYTITDVNNSGTQDSCSGSFSKN